MACILKLDPEAKFDFLAAKLTDTTLFFDCAESAARIESADLNDAVVAPADDGKITIQFKAGANSLKLTITGAAAGDKLRMNEMCGANPKIQHTFDFTGDPVVIYEIHAS